MPESDLTIDELIVLLRQTEESAPNEDRTALTSLEIQEHLGWSAKRTREALKALMREGRVKPVKVSRANAWGDHGRRPAWRFVTSDE